MIKKIEIDGLLSFEKFELELRNLNVLIGPNGSGKSNLIEVLSLLQALPRGNLGDVLNKGGGVDAWLRSAGVADVRVTADAVLPERADTISYSFQLECRASRHAIAEECITGIIPTPAVDLRHGKGSVARFSSLTPSNYAYDTTEVDFQTTTGSALKELRAPDSYPLPRHLGELFDAMRLYRDWEFGRNAPARDWQPTDLSVDFLTEARNNLALVINELVSGGTQEVINSEFVRFYERFRRFTVAIFGNRLLLRMDEDGLTEPIPATRWSDGMIRYLCLLAILCHPDPPPLICIDEPELGFHPDILHDLGRLIKEASERTQIIITTHSKDLVDEFSDDPSAVVVCERDFDGATRMERLDADRLAEWLERYTLGELWQKGEIGGDLY